MTLFNKKNIVIVIVVIVIIIICYVLYNKFYKNHQTNTIKKIQTSVGKNISLEDIQNKNIINPEVINLEVINQDVIKNVEGGDPYFEIQIENDRVGRITFELIDDVAPKTCENFRKLCSNGLNMNINPSYKNSKFHRIIKDFMIQGGDFTNHDGTGGYSIYGDKFEDESFELKHNQPGILSMANMGPNTNGSQFFICTQEAPHLDGKHVAFGIVKDGYDIIEQLNNIQTGKNDKPLVECKIIECGLC